MGLALGITARPQLFYPVINRWSDVWVIDKLLEDIASGGCTESEGHIDCGTRHIAVVVDTVMSLRGFGDLQVSPDGDLVGNSCACSLILRT